MRFLHSLLFPCTLIASLGLAQDISSFPLSSADAVPQAAQRELHVLSPTLAVEQIDRAVLNRLLQEISNDPVATASRLGASSTQLQAIFTILSNAHGFINDNDMANVRAMCKTWDASTLEGMARIEAALDAYKRRAKFTRDFNATYYRVVLPDIEAELGGPATTLLQNYMADRRRRMAKAGTAMAGTVVQNARSGADSSHFHCRTGKNVIEQD